MPFAFQEDHAVVKLLAVAKYQKFADFMLNKHAMFVVFERHKDLIPDTNILNYSNDFLK